MVFSSKGKNPANSTYKITLNVEYNSAHIITNTSFKIRKKQTNKKRSQKADQNHVPYAPDVRLLAIVALIGEYLRCHIVGCAAGGVEQLRARRVDRVGGTRHIQRGQAEVTDLQVAVLVEQ